MTVLAETKITPAVTDPEVTNTTITLPGRVTVRDDNHSIQLVIYRGGHAPVSLPVTPLYALTIAGELVDAATRALYREQDKTDRELRHLAG